MKTILNTMVGLVLLASFSHARAQAPSTANPRGHTAPEWLVAGVFAGLGGLSLYGIDAEPDIRPSTGDPYYLVRFDTAQPANWEKRSASRNGIVVVQDNLPDLAWSKGVGYAHVYIRSDAAQVTYFHLVHNGIGYAMWLDGKPLPATADPARPKPASQLDGGENKTIAEGVTDQGNHLQVELGSRQPPQLAELHFAPGWHRLLVKLVGQSEKGGAMAFSGYFTDRQGRTVDHLQTSVDDPEADARLHTSAARLTALVRTNAPFNLAYPKVPLSLSIELRPVPPHASKTPIAPVEPFDATLVARITDYDGQNVTQKQAAGKFPGTVSFVLGPAPATGYYAVHLSLVTTAGKLIANFPPDGFSVIGGTAAQAQRKIGKKMAVTYYFMTDGDLYKSLFFPYMRRIGIYRNVGGTNGRAYDFYKEAHDQGLFMAADFWNHDDPAYTEAYVQETRSFVDTYKSYNEIDLVPGQKKTSEYWVDREKIEYQTVKKNNPKATVLGGSLVRVGNDPWFERCLTLGLDQYQDAWDVHAYPMYPPRLEGNLAHSANESEQGILKVYRQLGKSNTKPFWMGETGARASHGSDARRWQATMIPKMAAWALSRSNFKVIGYLVPWGYSRENGLLNDIEFGHMPAEAAYYTASALVDGFPYERLAFGDAVQAARFGETTMFWTTGASQLISLSVKGTGPWITVDAVGRTKPARIENGAAKLAITDSPIYLLTQSTYDRLTGFSPEEAR